MHIVTVLLTILTVTALPTGLASPVKRRYSPSTDVSDYDTENVDPEILRSSTKKAKNFDGLPVKPVKASHFVLTGAATPVTHFNKPSVRLDTPMSPLGQRKRTATPSTAPTVAGRSPKSKRVGILSRRRTASSPFTRIEPPSFSSARARDAAPFSIDAALSGTVPSYNTTQKKEVYVPTLEDARPKGWVFDIYQDTEEDEMSNMMQHSTCKLDISDDESRRAAKDDRGKENIPPLDGPMASSLVNGTVAAGPSRRSDRRDEMIDESRSPMGELNAKDFYADGCDASSYVIVPAEKSNDKLATVAAPVEVKTTAEPTLPPVTATPQKQDGWKEFLAQVEEAKTAIMPTSVLDLPTEQEQQPRIDIWESESAKGDEVAVEEKVGSTMLLQESVTVIIKEEKVDDALMA